MMKIFVNTPIDLPRDLCYCRVVRIRNKKYNDLEKNQDTISLESFLEMYNKSVPGRFPSASVKALKQFQETYPSLFKKQDEWSIDRHRKRFMDWSFSNRKAA